MEYLVTLYVGSPHTIDVDQKSEKSSDLFRKSATPNGSHLILRCGELQLSRHRREIPRPVEEILLCSLRTLSFPTPRGLPEAISQWHERQSRSHPIGPYPVEFQSAAVTAHHHGQLLHASNDNGRTADCVRGNGFCSTVCPDCGISIHQAAARYALQHKPLVLRADLP